MLPDEVPPGAVSLEPHRTGSGKSACPCQLGRGGERCTTDIRCERPIRTFVDLDDRDPLGRIGCATLAPWPISSGTTCRFTPAATSSCNDHDEMYACLRLAVNETEVAVADARFAHPLDEDTQLDRARAAAIL
jgi:hypothetical protein